LPCFASHHSSVRRPVATCHHSSVRRPVATSPDRVIHPQADPSHPTINQTRTTTYHHPTGDPSEFFWFCDATVCSLISQPIINQAPTNILRYLLYSLFYNCFRKS
jgi:hypothetical protein